MKLRHFINLTNGIEALPLILSSGIQEDTISFMRLQSSHCESNNFVGILQDLDHNLLMRLALGDTCLVYDFGSRGTAWPDGTVGIPRAIWWGLEWVRYALNRSWVRQDPEKIMLRGYNVKSLFSKEYDLLPRPVRKKLRYYRPYLNLGSTNEVQLYGVFRSTQIDGKVEEYLGILQDNLLPDNIFDTEENSKLRAQPEESSESVLVSKESTSNNKKRVDISLPEGMRIFYNFDYEGVGRSGSGDNTRIQREDLSSQ